MISILKWFKLKKQVEPKDNEIIIKRQDPIDNNVKIYFNLKE